MEFRVWYGVTSCDVVWLSIVLARACDDLIEECVQSEVPVPESDV